MTKRDPIDDILDALHAFLTAPGDYGERAATVSVDNDGRVRLRMTTDTGFVE